MNSLPDSRNVRVSTLLRAGCLVYLMLALALWAKPADAKCNDTLQWLEMRKVKTPTVRYFEAMRAGKYRVALREISLAIELRSSSVTRAVPVAGFWLEWLWPVAQVGRLLHFD